MAVNNFLIFDPTSTNIEDQATYAADSRRLNGVAPGTASSLLANKTWRQSSAIAAVIGQFVVDIAALDMIDDGTTATLLANFEAALKQFFFNSHGSVYFQTPGSFTWTCPANVTKVYAEVWGAGGAGNGGTGGSGGGGGYAAGWVTVVPGTVYNFTVGTGGAISGGNGTASTIFTLTGGGGGGGSTGAGVPGSGSGGTINLSGGFGTDLDATGSYVLGAAGTAIGGSSPRGGSGGNVNAAGAVAGAIAPGGGGGANSANAGYAGAGANGAISLIW